MELPSPAATKIAPLHATPKSVEVVFDVLLVQALPSTEESMAPSSPTATKTSAFAPTAFSDFVTPEVLVVQTTPSGEVRTVPLAPTATYRFLA
jgi:hypothetical protein